MPKGVNAAYPNVLSRIHRRRSGGSQCGHCASTRGDDRPCAACAGAPRVTRRDAWPRAERFAGPGSGPDQLRPSWVEAGSGPSGPRWGSWECRHGEGGGQEAAWGRFAAGPAGPSSQRVRRAGGSAGGWPSQLPCTREIPRPSRPSDSCGRSKGVGHLHGRTSSLPSGSEAFDLVQLLCCQDATYASPTTSAGPTHLLEVPRSMHQL